jgi:hypothetical protein
MNKFRKHITKKRKLLKKKKRIHRRTVKKTKGGIGTKPILATAAGLLAFTNAFKPSGNSNIVMKASNRIEPIKPYSIGEQFKSGIQKTMPNSLNFVDTNSELGRPYHPTELSYIGGPPSDLPPDNSEMVFEDEPHNSEHNIDFKALSDFLKAHVISGLTSELKETFINKVRKFLLKIIEPVNVETAIKLLRSKLNSPLFTREELFKIVKAAANNRLK